MLLFPPLQTTYKDRRKVYKFHGSRGVGGGDWEANGNEKEWSYACSEKDPMRLQYPWNVNKRVEKDERVGVEGEKYNGNFLVQSISSLLGGENAYVNS